MNYNYLQTDKRWSKIKLGQSGLSMGNFGCVVVSCSIMLSYFLDREVLPSEFVKWLNENNGFTKDGLLYWTKVDQFSNNLLKFRGEEGTKEYKIFQVLYGRYNHWVLQDPDDDNAVIDPLGGTNPKNHYRFTGKVREFSGIPVKEKEYPVDNRYGQKRNWQSYMLEKTFAIPPAPASIYIRHKIKRAPTNREINALTYGRWGFGSVFENQVGNTWLYKTKNEHIFNNK